MPQTSLNVSQGDTVRVGDHNKVVTDIAALFAADTAAAAVAPTSDQKAALAGTSGTPSASNKFVTNADTRMPPTGTTGAGVVSGGQKIQSGKVSVSGVSSGTVTFPSAFSAPPVVILTPKAVVTGAPTPAINLMLGSTGTNPTATAFSWMRSQSIDEIHWMAIGT